MSQVLSLSVALIFLLPLGGLALPEELQTSSRPSGLARPTVKFKRLSTQHGLSESYVSTITQDLHGFLWFGTSYGLNRYDGYEFAVFLNTPGDSTSLSSNAIRALCPSRTGDLWVATAGGLNLFVHESQEFIRFLHDSVMPGGGRREVLDNLSSVCEDHRGDVWVGGSGGLSKLELREDGKRVFVDYGHVGAADGGGPAPVGVVYAILEDSEGVLWAGTARGITKCLRVKGGLQFVDYRRRPTEGVYRHSTLYEDPNGTLWLSGDDGALSWFDRDRDTVREFVSDGTRIETISQVVRDKKGRLWVASTYLGLFTLDYENRLVDHYELDPNDPESLPGNNVRAVFVDNAGNLWFGATGIGFIAANGSSFTTHRHRPNDPSSLSYDAINTAAFDRAGGLWVALTNAGDGIHYSSNGGPSFVQKRLAPGRMKTESMFTICGHSNGDVWFDAVERVVRFHRKTGEYIQYFPAQNSPHTISSSRIRSIVEDPDGLVWFATASGLDRYDPQSNEFGHFRHDPKDPNSLGGNHAISLCADRRGSVWVGTWGQGLNRLDRSTGKFTRYPRGAEDPGSLGTEIIHCMAEDTAGDIWISVRGNGLMRYSHAADRFTQVTEDDGLSGNLVTSIVIDGKGSVWTGTTKGLCRLDPRTMSFKRFGLSDGLPNTEFTFAACKAPDGRLYFGTRDGLVEFHPDSIKDNTFVPPIVVSSFKVQDHAVPFARDAEGSQPLTFPYDMNSVAFEFVALDYTAPEMNQYAYRLEGVDDDWIRSGTRRYASYPHLDPGEYVFRVKGSNSDGVWNEAGTSLRFVITPPYWKTWWFSSLIALLVVSGLYAFYRYRVARLLEVEQLRMRLAGDLHDELASNLSSIAMSSTMSETETPERMRETLSRVRTLAEESAGSIRDIIWALDPTTETLHDLLARAKYKLTSLCESRRMEFDFSLPQAETLPGANLSPETRRDLWLLLKEACMNAVKHSGCTRLSVEAQFEEGELRLRVSDNGRGFDAHAKHPGKGLTTMKMRAEQLRGSVVIDSPDGSGTTVSVSARL